MATCERPGTRINIVMDVVERMCGLIPFGCNGALNAGGMMMAIAPMTARLRFTRMNALNPVIVLRCASGFFWSSLTRYHGRRSESVIVFSHRSVMLATTACQSARKAVDAGAPALALAYAPYSLKVKVVSPIDPESAVTPIPDSSVEAICIGWLNVVQM